MTIKAAFVLMGLTWLVLTRPVAAHHSFSAEFDADKPIKLTGAVTQVEWTNPHAWIYIDVKDQAGKVENWGFELASPNGLMRSGWTRFSLKPGDVVTIEGTRAKNGSNRANAQNVLTPSGRKLFAGAATEQQP